MGLPQVAWWIQKCGTWLDLGGPEGVSQTIGE